jgi:hypothetical protein
VAVGSVWVTDVFVEAIVGLVVVVVNTTALLELSVFTFVAEIRKPPAPIVITKTKPPTNNGIDNFTDSFFILTLLKFQLTIFYTNETKSSYIIYLDTLTMKYLLKTNNYLSLTNFKLNKF